MKSSYLQQLTILPQERTMKP